MVGYMLNRDAKRAKKTHTETETEGERERHREGGGGELYKYIV